MRARHRADLVGSTNLSIDFLSFESSDEEKDVINVHSLPWRSRDYMYASNCDWSNIYNRIEQIPKCVGQKG